MKTLLDQCAHEHEFAFDLMSFDFEEVRVELERAGYHVHRDELRDRTIYVRLTPLGVPETEVAEAS